MTAIKYIDHVPRPKVRVLIDAAYADNGNPVFENYAEVDDTSQVDHAALEQLLDGAVWVGEGSPWEVPPAWLVGAEFWVTGIKSFYSSTPLEINRALAWTIANGLPAYPTEGEIHKHLRGKQLAVLGERGDVTHADVLVAVAAGRVWKP